MKSRHEKKTVTIRVDDLGRNEELDFVLLTALAAFKLPAILAVVPKWLTWKTGYFLSMLLDHSQGRMELAQHGFQHANYAGPDKLKYEFGPARDMQKQQQDIRAGQAIMAKYFAAYSGSIFIPPHNRLSQDTLVAITRHGFRVCLGGPRTFAGLRTPNELHTLMYQVDASKRVNGKRQSRSPYRIGQAVMKTTSPIIGLILHATEFIGAKQCLELAMELNQLRKFDFEFVTVREILKSSYRE